MPMDTDRNQESIHGGRDDVMSTSSSSYKSERKQGPCYELPDGTSISFQESSPGYDFRRLPELFFATGTLPFQTAPSSSSNTYNHNEASTSLMSIRELIQASLSAVPDADIRKELTSNIILTGASSLYGNMEQRLSLELSALLPNVFKTKVIASRDSVERRFAPWIGASILSSLGSFQQLWLGRREYDEYGALLSLQRFP
jgi:actin-related protein